MKTKILVGILVVVIVISGGWVILDQFQCEEFCTANLLEDCDGKRVSVMGTVKFSKTDFLCDIEDRDVKYTWLGDCILILNEDIPIPYNLSGKKVEVTGVIDASTGELCGVYRAEECAGKYYPTMIRIEEIEVMEDQNQSTGDIKITADKNLTGKIELIGSKVPSADMEFIYDQPCLFMPSDLSTETNCSKILGISSERGVDTDDDGLYDRLAITVEINVTETGNYLISGILGSGGNYIVSDTTGETRAMVTSVYYFPFHLERGIRTMELNFSGEGIYEKKQSGVYAVDVMLCGICNENMCSDSKSFNLSRYDYTEFQKLPAEITDTWEYLEDLDEDGLADYLAIEVQLDVWKSGNYTVYGSLDYLDERVGEYYISITGNRTESYLTRGKHKVRLRFDGTHIYKSKINGSFILNLQLGLMDEYHRYIGFRALNTSEHFYMEFQKPKVEFTGVYSDFGVDTDGDGRYNYLAVSVGVDVREAGEYEIFAWLGDENREMIDYCSNESYLSEGMQTVTLHFDGISIGSHDVDGYYMMASLLIRDLDNNDIDAVEDAYNSSFYRYADFEMPATVRGFIRDDRGHPIYKARVSLDPCHDFCGFDFTDENGSYSIARLMEGGYTVYVYRPERLNRAELKLNVSLSEGQTLVLNFTLERESAIKGTVVDAGGEAVYARVDITGDCVRTTCMVLGSTYTNLTGEYAFQGLKPGNYTIYAIPSNFNLIGTYRSEVEVSAGETAVVDIALKPCGSIRGKITDARGNPLAEAWAQIVGFETPLYHVCMHADECEVGTYVIPGLEPGEYEVRALVKIGEEYIEISPKKVYVGIGKTTRVDFTLTNNDQNDSRGN
jgi:hypothetical protein